MIDGIFIFDNVVHMYDMSENNLKSRPDTSIAQNHVLRVGGIARAAQETEKYRPFARQWTTADLGQLLFEDSATDMAMAQVVPLFDWWKDGFAPVRAQYEFARAYPDRVLFCGGVDPGFQGVEGAQESMREQVEMMGARSFKFYNAHIDGNSWRCDDKHLAYPLYEEALKLGVDVFQFHKGVPLGPVNIEDLRPNDLQAPARDFPSAQFIIHHLGMPYFEETLSIASRFPNVFLALSGNINACLLAPRAVQEQLGRLLLYCGAEKLLWGSEAPLYGSPQ
ncbi:MAG TPA: amidohydrolase family protein, partial [Anaerolineae bacterium]|nr:amidohydrolase family protein [Anaerolineae bacterium]